MPDIGCRRHGLAWPPLQLQEHDHKDHHKQKQKEEQKQEQPTRWRELQAAFQRPQKYLHASHAHAHARQERDYSHTHRSSVYEEANEWTAEYVCLHASQLMPATAITTQSATMAGTVRNGEQYALDNSPMSSPALPSDHIKSASTEDSTDPDITPKASLPSRSSRARGIFKVSSFLNLRSSNFGQIGNSTGNNGNIFSSNKSKRGAESGSRSTTPLQSPMDAPLASPWLASCRGGAVSRDGSWPGENGRGKEANSDYFHIDTPAISPALYPSITNTYSVPPTPVSATMPHDWKQWDQDHNKSPAILMNAADFTWHRPSFKQIIESLQVAVVSGEKVSPIYPGSCGESDSTEGRPSTSQSIFSSAAISSRSRRRPSKPTPPSPVTAGPENPIPGRYRSHIMCAIEGILDMQAALDDAKRRATEAEESRVRDLIQFAGLSEEWAERERQYELEICQLKDAMAAMAATASTSQPMRHRRMFSSLRCEESPAQAEPKPVSKAALEVPYKEDGRDADKLPTGDSNAGAGIQDTFMSRVRAAIETSSRTTKTKSAGEEVLVTVDKRQAKPALMCDLEHDKLMSDRLFWELSVAERNKCRQRRRYVARDHQAQHAEPASENTTRRQANPTKTKKVGHEQKGESSHESQESAVADGEAAACSLDETLNGKLKRKSRRQPRKSKRGELGSARAQDVVDDASFDTSPRQSAPSRPLGSARPSETKLVRWSTSRPFSPSGSEDDGGDDGSESSSSESSADDIKAGTGPIATAGCADGRLQSAADVEPVTDCTVVCMSPAGL